MSKCPICGGDMIAGGICHYNQDCPIHDQNVPTEVLELLDRTTKSLDVAVRALEDCEKILKHRRKDWGDLTANIALKQINEITKGGKDV